MTYPNLFRRGVLLPLFPLRARRRNQRGMSLIEVLIALMLLTIGLGGVMDLYTNQLKNVGWNQKRVRADHLARSRLAQLQIAGYARLKSQYLADSDEAVFDPGTDLECTAILENQKGEELQGLPARIKITVLVTLIEPTMGKSDIRALETHYNFRKAVGYAVAP